MLDVLGRMVLAAPRLSSAGWVAVILGVDYRGLALFPWRIETAVSTSLAERLSTPAETDANMSACV
jgi:hypothetical protein